MTTTLNQGQQMAADAFFAFLFSDEKEFSISGPGGVGKTYLMGHLIDVTMQRYFDTCKMMGIEPQYESVHMTATTNKAAEVLSLATGRPTQTIHSFLGLKVRDDYSTGRSILTKSNSWQVHEKKIIFIDESSMVDTPLMGMVHEATHQCKIIYVGDHCQLAPVMEPISPVYRDELPFHQLTEQMRNADQPALMNLCNQLRHSVETGEFLPIQIVPGVIDHLDDDQMQIEIANTFRTQTQASRILAYTNKRVMEFNDYIRQVRCLPDQYTEGEFLVNNSAVQLKNRMLSVEEEVTVDAISPTAETIRINDEVDLTFRRAQLKTRLGELLRDVPIVEDRDHFDALIRYYKGKKLWYWFYQLKNTYPDLRPRDAATVHKAQGSTHDSVFIDLGNVSTCHQPHVVARMLYVAVSRPRNRIFLFGDLAQKYGGLIH